MTPAFPRPGNRAPLTARRSHRARERTARPGTGSSAGWCSRRRSRPFRTAFRRRFWPSLPDAPTGRSSATRRHRARRFSTSSGAEHLATGKWIVYTSADSVFQVAAHEDVVPLSELYDACEVARGLLIGPNGVSRVIARPFRGVPGAFQRTSNRKDFSREPTGPTLLDHLAAFQVPVHWRRQGG